MKSVEETLACVRKNIPSNCRTAMFSALIVGVVTHMFVWNNVLMNGDSMDFLIGTEGVLSSGRWLLGPLGRLRGLVFSTSISTPLALLWLSITSAMLVQYFQIKKPFHAALIGVLIVTIPSVFCTMSFIRQETFFFSLMLMALGMLCARRENWRAYALAVLCMTLSLGIYQSYLGLAAAGFVISLICGLLIGEKNWQQTLRNAIRLVSILFLSVVAYYVILQLVLRATQTGLSGYLGINQMGTFDLANIPHMLTESLAYVWRFFWLDYMGTRRRLFVLLYRAILLINLGLMLLLIVKSRLFRHVPEFLVTLLLLLLFPFAINSSYLLLNISGVMIDPHWLMIFPFVLAFILPLILLELYQSMSPTTDKAQRMIVAGEWLLTIYLLVLAFNWFILANQAYRRLQNAYEKAYAISNRLADDILKTEGFSKDMPVSFIGHDNAYAYSPEYQKDLFGVLERFTGITGDNFGSDQVHLIPFLRNYIGLPLTPASAEFNAQFLQSPEFSEMGVWPFEDAIRIVDETLVVKISE